uniref:Uncharacterized protein n=1 Tax=Rhizophora mucronata TaxID=61149 RepID=A0A2P2R451_RHIMU
MPVKGEPFCLYQSERKRRVCRASPISKRHPSIKFTLFL